MEVLKIILTILEVIASVALVTVILLQSGKESGLGAISGNNDSYLSKSKRGSLDKVMASATKWIAVAASGSVPEPVLMKMEITTGADPVVIFIDFSPPM